jgi:putative tryptophan/tyrosine transport system substrate-binding protein
MRRRKFITLVGGAAAMPAILRPLDASAQQPARLKRVGVLVAGLPADDPEWQARGTAFVQRLQDLGWTDGRNTRLDFRFSLGDPDRSRKYAAELTALAPDVILAGGAPAVASLQLATRTIPIVFANVIDPVGRGFVASLARPGGNISGFMSLEFGLGAKWLELLKEVAPGVKRVAVIRNPTNTSEVAQFGAIQAVASSFGVELTPIWGDAGEIERALTDFVRAPNGGLIVPSAGTPQNRRELIIAFATRHKLPAVYPFRGFVAEGGLISYGINQAEPYRLAAGYVDRILKGEKPADLPVQAPTRYETVLNLKTAKALGLDVPAEVLVRADEVIE